MNDRLSLFLFMNDRPSLFLPHLYIFKKMYRTPAKHFSCQESFRPLPD